MLAAAELSKKEREDNLIAETGNASKKKKKKIEKSDNDAVIPSGTNENIKGSKNSVEMTNGTVPESKTIAEEKVEEAKFHLISGGNEGFCSQDIL